MCYFLDLELESDRKEDHLEEAKVCKKEENKTLAQGSLGEFDDHPPDPAPQPSSSHSAGIFCALFLFCQPHLGWNLSWFTVTRRRERRSSLIESIQ